jgi:hypothetical protein
MMMNVMVIFIMAILLSMMLLLWQCDTPVSPRVSLKKPHQEPLFYVNQSKHEHQNNLSDKEFTKYMFKSVMIKTIESLKRVRMCNPN